MNNLIPLYAEVFVTVAASVILLVDMFLADRQRHLTYLMSIVTLAGAAVITWGDLRAGTTTAAFSNMFVNDPMANLLKLFTYLATGFTLVYSRQYVDQREMTNTHLGGEYYVLALFSMVGQMVMISAHNMLALYLGLELMSLSLYALVALRRDHAMSTEASMKYFVLGALASGFLLYGISMLYGATGTLDIQTMLKIAASGTVKPTILVFGIVFAVAGLAFKLGAVPFHMWVPDVYQGAPTSVTLLLGGAPKLATFAICIRLLVEGLLPLAGDWQQMLVVLAVLSLAIGNLTAIAQTNIKRMLAYSTIAQMGFVLLGLAVGVTRDATGAASPANAMAAYSAAMYYAIVYVLTTLGTFGLVMLLARSGFEAEEIGDFRGLGKRSPWYAAVMSILVLSLAGVPPMIGFWAKLAVLQAVMNAGQTWLAVFAVMFSLVGAFYYLRVMKTMWFDEPVDTAPIVAPADMRFALTVNGLFILVAGVVPAALMEACLHAMQKTLVF
ncbi:MAG: NADH-quinone oxidoreductase subunit NuoN [Telluria sp.]